MTNLRNPDNQELDLFIPDEEWSIIPFFPNYLVSNLGRVKTMSRPLRYTHAVTGSEHFRKSTERFLKVQQTLGYKFVQLYKDHKMHNKVIHRLVAAAFIPRIEGMGYVNHKDGNKHNNVVSNLEWCTNEYNHEHATKTGLKSRGTEVKNAKLNDSSVLAIRNMLNEGVNRASIAKWFNVSLSSINHIKMGNTWKHV